MQLDRYSGDARHFFQCINGSFDLKNMRLKFLISSLATGSLAISFAISQPAVSYVGYSASVDTPLLLATAYTDQTLLTLRRGDRGEAVRKLQGILQANGFLGAANVRLGNPGLNVVDGIFGAVTESAIKDLQQRYDLPITGIVNPATWEVLDTQENPDKAPLPWRF